MPHTRLTQPIRIGISIHNHQDAQHCGLCRKHDWEDNCTCTVPRCTQRPCRPNHSCSSMQASPSLIPHTPIACSCCARRGGSAPSHVNGAQPTMAAPPAAAGEYRCATGLQGGGCWGMGSSCQAAGLKGGLLWDEQQLGGSCRVTVRTCCMCCMRGRTGGVHASTGT